MQRHDIHIKKNTYAHNLPNKVKWIAAFEPNFNKMFPRSVTFVPVLSASDRAGETGPSYP